MSTTDKEYVLSKSVVTDGDSVRSLAILTTNDNNTSSILLSGAEGGMLSTTNLSSYDTSILSTGSTRHAHTITALLAVTTREAGEGNGEASYITACKDTIIRIFSSSNELILTLEGHEKAVTSLSWLTVPNRHPILVSGSWDGTAKLWNIQTGMCLATLTGHENTVTVQGLPPLPTNDNNDDSICQLATGSAGVANGNVIRDHKIRLWNITVSADMSHVKTELKTTVANDHGGPIRGLSYEPQSQMLLSCSNDGTVKVRDGIVGDCITTLSFTEQPMLLDVQALSNGSVIAGAEDGNVIVWNVQGGESSFQVIPHPNSVWAVLPLSNGEFCTACHDGCIRFFTLDEGKYASAEEISAFTDAVQEARAKASTGPSAEEIAKLPRWEENASHLGKSDGQVQVFQKNGKAIAAQWSVSSGTWIEVGEVTGRNDNTGTINGVKYDHIFPIEVDVPGGNVQSLQIGYNEGDNPFVTAQAFIDEHQLDQGYLAQIADYIRQRVGEGSVPTIGADTGASASSGPTPMDIVPTTPTPVSYEHLPMQGYKSFENGAEASTLNKMVTKIREFNGSVENSLSSSEVTDVLDSLCSTLTATSRYHASTISDNELNVVKKMVNDWSLLHAFPALDLARLLVIHPDASKCTRKQLWVDIIDAALDKCNALKASNIEGMPAIAIPMLSMRLFANCFRGGNGASSAVISRVSKILKCLESFLSSKNKNMRLAISTVLLNIASHFHNNGSFQDSSIPTTYLSVISGVVASGAYETEALVRVLVGLGTILLVKENGSVQEAKALQVSSMVQRASTGHGEKAIAVAKEIQTILQ